MIPVSALPPICVALGCSDAARLRRLAVHACDNGEDFLEIRLDALDRPEAGIGVIRRLLRRFPETAILATCRRRENGGHFKGSIRQQIEILEKAIAAGVALVDVEIESAEADPELLPALRERARVVLSYHNFERTPALSPIVKRLRKIEADIYKVTTAARKPSDNLKVLELPAAWPKERFVAMAMGEAGAPSRILGPSRRATFVYASATPPATRAKDGRPGSLDAQPTAPGQITASRLRTCYRAHKRRPSAKVYGVIANPVMQSLSPVLHNRAFRSRRVDAVYVPFLVENTKLADFFRVVEKLPVAGFSVTIPHKQRVMRYLDSVDALARRIGAVNTVYRRRGKLYGTNTDAMGVTAPLEKTTKLNKAKALIAGNGGAARAAVVALLDKGAQVSLTGRDPQHVRSLARAYGVEAVERAGLDERYFDILIHATPLGMYPQPEECFFPGRIPADLVFDMVYNPLETTLLRRARSQGKETIPGLEMFLGQAAAQFEIWTGETAPRTVMRNAVLEALEGTLG